MKNLNSVTNLLCSAIKKLSSEYALFLAIDNNMCAFLSVPFGARWIFDAGFKWDYIATSFICSFLLLKYSQIFHSRQCVGVRLCFWFSVWLKMIRRVEDEIRTKFKCSFPLMLQLVFKLQQRTLECRAHFRNFSFVSFKSANLTMYVNFFAVVVNIPSIKTIVKEAENKENRGEFGTYARTGNWAIYSNFKNRS